MVVVGSNNSAMDISAVVDNGIDVTMIQRSSTHVKSDSLDGDRAQRSVQSAPSDSG